MTSKFSKVVNNLMARGYTREEAEKIASAIGRRKYGNKKFQQMALAGRMKLYAKKKR